MRTLFLGSLVLGCIGCSPSHQDRLADYRPSLPWRESNDQGDSACSTVEDFRLLLVQSKVRLTIPESWKAREIQRGQVRWNWNVAFYASANEIVARIQQPNKWDEFVGFCNGVFPSDRCALIAESRYQLRIYDLNESVDAVRRRIGKVGTREIFQVAHRKELAMEDTQEGNWHRISYRYALGGEDIYWSREIDCYLRPVGQRAIAFCFDSMPADYVAYLLKSVEIPSSDQHKD